MSTDLNLDTIAHLLRTWHGGATARVRRRRARRASEQRANAIAMAYVFGGPGAAEWAEARLPDQPDDAERVIARARTVDRQLRVLFNVLACVALALMLVAACLNQ